MSPSDLTDAEAAELGALHAAWTAARAEKRWAEADDYRARLQAWGCSGPNLDRWHPVFESAEHRAARLAKREVA